MVNGVKYLGNRTIKSFLVNDLLNRMKQSNITTGHVSKERDENI